MCMSAVPGRCSFASMRIAGNSGAPHAQRISLTRAEDIAVYCVPGCWLKGDTGEQAARAERLLAAVLRPSLSRSTTKGRFSVKAQRLGRASRERLSRVCCFAELRPDLVGAPLYRLEWIARIARRGELDHLSREQRLDVAVGCLHAVGAGLAAAHHRQSLLARSAVSHLARRAASLDRRCHSGRRRYVPGAQRHPGVVSRVHRFGGDCPAIVLLSHGRHWSVRPGTCRRDRRAAPVQARSTARRSAVEGRTTAGREHRHGSTAGS